MVSLSKAKILDFVLSYSQARWNDSHSNSLWSKLLMMFRKKLGIKSKRYKTSETVLTKSLSNAMAILLEFNI
jgi:hypothetical protein